MCYNEMTRSTCITIDINTGFTMINFFVFPRYNLPWFYKDFFVFIQTHAVATSTHMHDDDDEFMMTVYNHGTARLTKPFL